MRSGRFVEATEASSHEPEAPGQTSPIISASTARTTPTPSTPARTLASSYRATGDLPRAIALHEQSVTDYARVFGPDHSETVTARSNLAYACQLAGGYGRAVPLHR